MNIAQKTVNYFTSVKEEFKKVSWPSRKDTIRYSGLVIGVSVLVSAFFATLDAGFSKIVDAGISYRNQQTAGQIQLPTASTGDDIQVTPTATPAPAATAPGTIDLNNVTPLTTPTPAPAPDTKK